MDPDTIDQSYAQLEQQGAQTATLIQALADKLHAASAAGDPNAREWTLDLKEIAIGVQQEQGETTLLLQNIHGMIQNHVAQTSPPLEQQPPSAPQQYAPPPQQYAQQQYAPQQSGGFFGGGGGGGGTLQRFLGGSMGRAIMQGAGFGIGDDLINHLL